MGFGQAVASAFANYFNFSGRALRSEYWYFSLFLVIVSIAAILVDSFVLGFLYPESIGPVYIVFSLATIVPAFSVAARRLHDIGRSGWWVLLYLIPIIGWIILIVWACQESDAGPNAYGAPAVAY